MMKITFLGVGESCDPARPNTSLLVETHGEAGSRQLLLDCGFTVPHQYFARSSDPNQLNALCFYSGDGLPTPATVALARGCDLAVHEAFHLHEESEGHGSVRRCLKFASQAGVPRLALVHMAWPERRREQDIAHLLGEAPPGGVFLPDAGEEIRL